jgi:hypothetical protein
MVAGHVAQAPQKLNHNPIVMALPSLIMITENNKERADGEREIDGDARGHAHSHCALAPHSRKNNIYFYYTLFYLSLKK